MIPSSPSDSDLDTSKQPQNQNLLLAYQMYERLRRMSDDRKLNLSAEDVLISAYLGCNLVYRCRADSDASDTDIRRPGNDFQCLRVGVNHE